MATDIRNPQQAWQLADQAQARAVAAQGRVTYPGLAWLAGSLACDADRLAPQPADWRPVHQVRVGDLVVVRGAHDGGRTARGQVVPVAEVRYEGGRWYLVVGDRRCGNRNRVLYPKGVAAGHHTLVVRRGA